MADIVIRGMDVLPMQCVSCPCWELASIGNGQYVDWCKAAKMIVDPYSKPDNCPLIFAQETQEQKEQASPQADAGWSELMEDLDAAETLCCQTESLPDIFPTRVIRTICKLQYRALMREAKRLKRRRQDYDQR